MESRKYGRTYHFPFSPGTTSDDRIQHDYWHYLSQMQDVVHTEKLDGENNCLNKYGVFARSHAAPTTSPWTSHLRQRWEAIKHDLGDLELFGENIYAIHSIEYQQIAHHFYVFAVRHHDQWLSWDEVCFYAAAFDFPVVPILWRGNPIKDELLFKQSVLALTQQQSAFASIDVQTKNVCTIEGVVSRDANGFGLQELGQHVFKYVRKCHVKTDEHWTRNWKRARLIYEHKNTIP